MVAGWPWLGSQGQGEGGWWVKEAEGRQAPLPSPAGWVWGGDKSSRRWSHGFICPGVYCIFKRHILAGASSSKEDWGTLNGSSLCKDPGPQAGSDLPRSLCIPAHDTASGIPLHPLCLPAAPTDQNRDHYQRVLACLVMAALRPAPSPQSHPGTGSGHSPSAHQRGGIHRARSCLLNGQ